MGYKFNDATGKWEAWYVKRHPDTGKPISLKKRNLNSEAEAKKAERKLIESVSGKIHEQRFPLWPQLIDAYVKDCRDRGLTEKTIYNAKHGLEATTLEKWKTTTIDRISTEDIRNLLREGCQSETHKKSLLKFFRGAFNFAVEANWLQRNPAPKMTWRIKNKIKAVLTEEQIRFFLRKARDHEWEWYPHCTMALYTGMRSGELFALRWDKVNLGLRQILVDQSWNNKDGFKSTKSGDDRIIEIAPTLIPLLEELKLATYQSGFVLPRIGRWDKGEQARELRMFLTGIGLPPVRFHDLRATWATQMLSRGIEPIKVMMMGGWRELKTMQIYIRKAGVDIRGITDNLVFHDHRQQDAKVVNITGNHWKS